MKKQDEKKIRNWLAVEAFQKSGAGKHGGSKKQQRKQQRKAGRKACREDY